MLLRCAYTGLGGLMHGVWLVVSGLWFAMCLADALWLGKPKVDFPVSNVVVLEQGLVIITWTGIKRKSHIKQCHLHPHCMLLLPVSEKQCLHSSRKVLSC